MDPRKTGCQAFGRTGLTLNIAVEDVDAAL